MNQDIFVNEAINEGITNFVEGKNTQDFITIIVCTLVNIFGQLDVVNPYKTKSEKSFDNNLTKFGYSKESLSLFKQNVLNFYLSKEQCPNKYFNKIEKQLIDMFFLKIKKVNTQDSEIAAFKSYIQFENSTLNQKYSNDNKEISKYFNYKNKMLTFNINYKIEPQNKLNREAYEVLGYSYDNIVNMNEQQIANINQKIFEYYKIDSTKEDRFLRLDQAIAYFKQFPKKEEQKPENGYTEFILLVAFVIISILSIAIVVGVLSK